MSSYTFPDLKLGFLGHGKMFQALSTGFITANLVNPSNIVASDLHLAESEAVGEHGVRFYNTNMEVVMQSDVVILAVKPNIIAPVLKEVVSYIEKRHLLVSIAAGVTIQQIQEICPSDTRVMRVLPNTPCLVKCGMSVCTSGPHSTPEDLSIIQCLFSSVGLCDVLPEKYLDAVSSLSGAGPAFAYIAVEALSDAGVKMGLPRDKATKHAAQTLMGAGKMVLETGKHPGELKDAVCSPGGCTIAGVHALEKAGFRSALIDAVEAATNRTKHLSQS